MVDESLSKDEVEALLTGIAEGAVAGAEAAAPAADVQSYELVRDRTGAAAQAPPLALVHERFARQVAKAIGARLSAAAAVECGDRELLQFAAFRDRIPGGANLCWFTGEPGGGHGLVVVSPALAFELVDRLFGGPGRVPPNAAERSYSSIELSTIRGFAQRVLDALVVACAPIAEVRLVLDRTGDPLTRFALADAAELLLMIALECDLGSGAGRILVALPRGVFSVLCGGADAGRSAEAEDPQWSRAMRQAVHAAEVSMTAELGRRELRAGEVLRLRVGDVVPLQTRGDDAVVVRVEGRPLLRGVAGVSRGQNAVRIVGLEGGE
jgi:flagellar motor switch protein FliM